MEHRALACVQRSARAALSRGGDRRPHRRAGGAHRRPSLLRRFHRPDRGRRPRGAPPRYPLRPRVDRDGPRAARGERVFRRGDAPGPPGAPLRLNVDCSILLATRDRAASLDRTLASIAGQQSPGIAWEVLVADNGSTDETGAVLQRWAARVPLRTVFERGPGKNRALNQALAMARGGLLLFTDDDVVAQPGWIAAHAAAAARWPDHQIFGGLITPRFPRDPPAWALRDPFVSVLFAAYDPGGAEGPTTELPFGPNYSLRAEC